MKLRVLVPLLVAFLSAACADQSPTGLLESALPPLFALGCELGVSDAQALTEITALRAEVDALEASGSLNAGQARALRNHLDNAARHIEEGRYCAAAAQLRAFGGQVGNFVEAGHLTEAEASPLLDAVDRLLGDEPQITQIVSPGSSHTCGLTATGRAYCWGNNETDALGDGTGEDRLLPVAVNTPYRFQSISTGLGYTCAVALDGRVLCWGRNTRGQLGNGTTEPEPLPAAIASTQSFRAVVAGVDHTCAIADDRSAYCWGRNFNGQLGNGGTTDSSSPVRVGGTVEWRSLAVGSAFTCGLSESGIAYCWGDGIRTGHGTDEWQTLPAPVLTELRFAQIGARNFHACALATSGIVQCWGGNNSGELGDGVSPRSLEPVDVASELTFAFLAVGAGYSCALAAEGAAFCWGNNSLGEHGSGTVTPLDGAAPMKGQVAVPTASAVGQTWRALFGGGAHTCGITTGEAVYCWGANASGQVGDGTTIDRLEPALVSGWEALP